MGVILAFLVGYVVGNRAGRDSLQELVDSSKTIASSPEFRRILSNAVSTASATVADNLTHLPTSMIGHRRSANG